MPKPRGWQRGRVRAGRGVGVATALAAALHLSLACTTRPEPSAEDRARLAAYVLDAPPADVGRRVDIDFDGKVVLLGAQVEPSGPISPGQQVRLRWFWSARARVGPRVSLFTHVLDGAGVRVLNIDNVGPLRQWKERRQLLGPWAWEPGKIYVDEQDFTVPPSITTGKLQIVGGLFEGARRLPIRAGAHDREQRGLFAELVVRRPVGERPRARVPHLDAPRIARASAPRIDGRLDEPVWLNAASTGPFVDVATGEVSRRVDLAASAQVLWDETAMYLGVTVTDRDLEGGFPAGAIDPHLWTRDAVEVMLDPDGDGDGRDYYEIQVGPQNLVFDSRFDDYNSPRGGPDGPFGHQGWSSQLTSAVTLLGTIDVSTDRDRGYVVEMRLPWSAFDRARRTPPAPGDEWRANLYAVEHDGGVAWSPILGQGNFHRASRFGRLRFAAADAPAGGASAPTVGSGAASAPPPASGHPLQGR